MNIGIIKKSILCVQMKKFNSFTIILSITLKANIIVEIGTFFGAMTQAIRLGCNDKTKKIITCDFFRWDSDKQTKYPERGYSNGDDFKELIENLSHLENIKLQKRFHKIKDKRKY